MYHSRALRVLSNKLCCSVLCRSSTPASTSPPLQTSLRSRLHKCGKFLNGQKPARIHLSLTHRPAGLCKFLNGKAASCKRVVDRKNNSSFKTFSGPGSSACSALNRIDLEALCATFKKCYTCMS